ncbi:hypothetical protein KI387_025258, partial [Taxus chinensis]
APRQNKKVNAPVVKKREPLKIWKQKQEEVNQDNEKSMIVQTTFHAQDEGKQWYIDSGCSRHMTGDKRKFITLKEMSQGMVKFGDNATTQIAGK